MVDMLLSDELPYPQPAGRPSFWSVIPAGGAGTRLWPMSRAARPKFLLPLLDSRSLLQQTVERLTPFAPPEQTLIVCGTAHAVEISRQVPGLPATSVVVEPSPKGSGPAIGLAAAIVARHDPDGIMGSFAADHVVRDQSAFEHAVRAAIQTASAGWLVTVGLTPDRPETGYGYIERTDEIVAGSADGLAYRSSRFVEKPDILRATAYLESGRYLWNASMFIWRAQTLLDEMARLQPELHAGVTRIAEAWGTPAQEQVTAEVWATLPESTIDQGIMEHAAKVAVVPAEMGWSDVGDWHGVSQLLDVDADGNSARQDMIMVGTRNCSVWSSTDRLVAVVGLDNVVVVDTPDSVLVVDRTRAQDVRSVVDRLKAQALTERV